MVEMDTKAEARDWQTRQLRYTFRCDPSNDMLVGPDGCHYDTQAEAMYFNLKASCGCGRPDEVHAFLIECIKQFDGDKWPKPGVDSIAKFVSERPDVAAEFIAHYLTSEALLEHGGSVYGSWLTDRGKQFIEIGPVVDRD